MAQPMDPEVFVRPELMGILSMDDIIAPGDMNKWEGCCEVSSEEIIRSLKKPYSQKFPVVRSQAVAA